MKVAPQKLTIIREVEPVKDLLVEIKSKLQDTPRSKYAAQNLSQIINKLDKFSETFMPQKTASVDPSRQEIDEVLIRYKEQGYFALSEREKFVINYFDRNYNVSKK